MQTVLYAGGFSDEFKVECMDPGKYETYDTTNPEPGVLWVTLNDSDCDESDKKQSVAQDQLEEEAEDGALSADQSDKIIVQADPHMTTLDGLRYDLQSVGEFQLAIIAR